MSKTRKTNTAVHKTKITLLRKILIDFRCGQSTIVDKVDKMDSVEGTGTTLHLSPLKDIQ